MALADPILIGPIDNNPPPLTETSSGVTVTLVDFQELTLTGTGNDTVNSSDGGLKNIVNVSGNGENGPVDIIDLSVSTINEGANSNIDVAGNADNIVASAGDWLTINGDDVVTLASASTLWLNGDEAGDINAVAGDVVNVAANVGGTNDGISISNGTVNVGGADDVIYISNGTVNVGANSQVEIVGNNDTIITSASSTISVTGFGDNVAAGANSTVDLVVNGTGDNAGQGDIVACGPGGTINLAGNGQNGAATAITATNGGTINLVTPSNADISGSNYTVEGGTDDTVSATAAGAATINLDTGSNVTVNETAAVTTPEIVVDLFGGTLNTTSGAIDIVGDNDSLRVELTARLNAAAANPGEIDVEGNNDDLTIPTGGVLQLSGNLNNVVGGQDSKSTITGVGNGASVGVDSSLTVTGGGGDNLTAGAGSDVSVSGNGENGQPDNVVGSNLSVTAANDSNADITGAQNQIVAGSQTAMTVNGPENDLQQGSSSVGYLNGDTDGAYQGGLNSSVDVGNGTQGVQISDPGGTANLGNGVSATILSSNTKVGGDGNDTITIAQSNDPVTDNNSNVKVVLAPGATNAGDTVTGTGDTTSGTFATGSSGGGSNGGGGFSGGEEGPWTWGPADDFSSYSGSLGYGGETYSPFSQNDILDNEWNGTLTTTVDSAGSSTSDFAALQAIANNIASTYAVAGQQWSGSWTLTGGSISTTYQGAKAVYVTYTLDIGGQILGLFVYANSAPSVVNYSGTGFLATVADFLNNYDPSSGVPGGGGNGGGGGNPPSTITGHTIGGSTISLTAAAVVSVSQFESEQSTLDQGANGFIISDSAENVASDIVALNNDPNLVAIVLTNTDPLVLSVSQALDQTAALAVIAGSYQITISDSAANVAANLDALNALTPVMEIDLTDSGAPLLTLSVSEALLDAPALDEIAGAFTIALTDTAADVAANIDALNADTHVASITLTDGGTPSLTLSVAQALNDAMALGEIKGAYKVSLSDTGADIASLTSTQAAALEAAGYTSIGATGAVTLNLAEAELLAGDGLMVTGATVSLSDTAANIEAITSTQAAALEAAGYTSIGATGAVTLNLAEAELLAGDGLMVTGATVSLSDTAANIEAITSTQAAALKAAGYTSIAATGAVTLSLAQAELLAGDGLMVTGGTVSLSDTAANIEAITSTQAAALKAAGYISIGATGAVILGVAQFTAFETTGIKLTVPTGDTIVVSDTAANISSYLDALAASPPAAIMVSDNQPLTISYAQITSDAAALAVTKDANGSAYTLNVSGVLSATDAATLETKSHVASFSVADIAANLLLKVNAAGLAKASSVTLTGANTVTAAQAETLAKLKGFTVGADATLVVSDSAADLLNSANAGGIAQATGVTLTGANAVTAAQAAELAGLTGFALGSGATLVVSDSAADLLANAAGLAKATSVKLTGTNTETAANAETLAGLTGFALGSSATLVVADSAADLLNTANAGGLAKATSVKLTGMGTLLNVDAEQAETLAEMKGFTVLAGAVLVIADEAADLLLSGNAAGLAKATSVTLTNSYTATAAQAEALSKLKDFTLASGDTLAVSDTAKDIEALTTTLIGELAVAHVSSVGASDASLTLTEARAAAFENANITLSADGAVALSDTAADIAKLTTTQLSDLVYDGITALNVASGALTLSVAKMGVLPAGLAVTETGTATVTEDSSTGYATYEKDELIAKKTLNGDGSYDIAHSFVTGFAYASYEDIYSKAATKLAEQQNLTTGAGNLVLDTGGLTVASSSGVFSVADATDTFSLAAFLEQTIAATGEKGETFDFGTGFGADTIAGFAAGKATGHDVLEFSASSGITDLATLLADTTQNKAGSAVITLDGSDSVTLTGISMKTLSLAANAVDFKFG